MKETFRIIGLVFLAIGMVMLSRHTVDKKEKEYDLAFIIAGVVCSLVPLLF